MIGISILTIGILASILTGLFVVTRNPRNKVNLLYGSLALWLSVFSFANHLSLQTNDRLFLIRLVIFSSALAVASLYYLVTTLAKRKAKLSNSQRAGVYFTLFVAIISFTPLVFSGLSEGNDPTPIPNFGAFLYFLHIVLIMGASFFVLIRSAKKSHGLEHRQYTYMLIGLIPMLFLAPITGFVFPIILKNPNFIILSPIYTTFFVLMVGFAIIRHKLFDIKLIVARSIAYILLLVFVTIIFAGLIITIPASLFDRRAPNLNLQLYYTFSAVLLAFLFQPLRSFFNKITNSLFYQDAYDPQEFLDELNGTVISNIELNDLLSKCAGVIEKHLKVDYCVFGINETTYLNWKVVGSDHKKFSEDDIKAVRSTVQIIKQRIIDTDLLEDEYEDVKRALEGANITVIGRLSTDTSNLKEGIGYLIMGPKKSGNLFNRQDVKMLDIITKELVVAIQNALRFEQIKSFNLTLQKKVETSTHELRRSNDRLKELDETKDDFISMASHQLRTPLTSVKGYLSMVLEGDAGELTKNQKKMLSQAYISSQRMVFLISDLLNLSRLKTGKFIIESRPVNLTEIIESEVDQLAETASARDLKLNFDKPESFPTLILDETKIRQVIMNFVDNAIYYTPSGGNINVRLKENQHSIECTVTDDGIGIPKHEQHHLFTKFFRAGNAKKARPDGTGLGLFMAKKVIIAQGGGVIFNSQEGKGSTFGFTFPKSKLKPPVITPKAS